MIPISIQDLFETSSFKHSAIFQDCEFPWEALGKIHVYLKKNHLGKIDVGIPAGAHLIHPELISIGKGTVIEPGAYIVGPCIIGKNCSIRQGAYIRGDVIVGNNCVVGHDTEVKNSIFFDGANAAHFAYVGDSILGNGVNLGAGCKLANFRLDHQEIFIVFDGKKTPTGLRKFGAILGDQTQIGCNSVSNPGTITGKQVHCFPCVNFSGFIPKNSVVKPPYLPTIITQAKPH